MCDSEGFEVVPSFGFMSWVGYKAKFVLCHSCRSHACIIKIKWKYKKPQIVIRKGQRDVESGCVCFYLFILPVLCISLEMLYKLS